MNTEFDRFKVDELLMNALALADVIGCAGISETAPQRDTISLVSDMLAHTIAQVRAEIFDRCTAGDAGRVET